MHRRSDQMFHFAAGCPVELDTHVCDGERRMQLAAGCYRNVLGMAPAPVGTGCCRMESQSHKAGRVCCQL